MKNKCALHTMYVHMYTDAPCSVKIRLNSLPDDKILDWSKLKAFADDNFDITEMVQFFPDQVENIVGKGENAGYQHFLLFPRCFQKAFFSGSL